MTLPDYIAIPELQHNRVRVLGSPLREPVFRKVAALLPGAIHLQAFDRDALVFLWNGALRTPGTGYVDGHIHPEDLEVLRRFAKRAAKGEPVTVDETPDAFEPEPPLALVPGLAHPEASTSAEIAAALNENAQGSGPYIAVAVDDRTLGFVPRPPPPPPRLVLAEPPAMPRPVTPPAPVAPAAPAAPVVDRDIKPGNITRQKPASAPPPTDVRAGVERLTDLLLDPAKITKPPPRPPASRVAESVERVSQKRGAGNLTVYSPRLKLEENQRIFHASFGEGTVDKITGARAVVIFTSGARTLAHAGGP